MVERAALEMRYTHYVVSGVRIPHSPPKIMSEQNRYMVNLAQLPLGVHTFEIRLDDAFFSSLEKTEILGGEVSAKAVLQLREEDYTLKISVHGTVFVVCDRCLDPMPLEIDDEQEIWSDDEEDNNQSPMTNHQLDLSWLVYEIVSINIPIVHSHQAGECNKQMELLLHNHLCDDSEPDC